MLHLKRRDLHEGFDVFGQPNLLGSIGVIESTKTFEMIDHDAAVFFSPG
jgi:hypothetical protein